jgi:hypothetical protein
MDSNNPQIAIQLLSSYSSTMSMLYFAQLSFSRCWYMISSVLLLTAIFNLIVVNILATRCQAIINQINLTHDCINKDRNILLMDDQCTGQV